MDFKTFKHSLSEKEPPDGLSLALQSLWYDAKGEWDKAHMCTQEQNDQTGAWVHAYLHRKEGDPGNAAYWYRRAGKPPSNASLEEEWESLVTALL